MLQIGNAFVWLAHTEKYWFLIDLIPTSSLGCQVMCLIETLHSLCVGLLYINIHLTHYTTGNIRDSLVFVLTPFGSHSFLCF